MSSTSTIETKPNITEGQKEPDYTASKRASRSSSSSIQSQHTLQPQGQASSSTSSTMQAPQGRMVYPSGIPGQGAGVLHVGENSMSRMSTSTNMSQQTLLENSEDEGEFLPIPADYQYHHYPNTIHHQHAQPPARSVSPYYPMGHPNNAGPQQQAQMVYPHPGQPGPSGYAHAQHYPPPQFAASPTIAMHHPGQPQMISPTNGMHMQMTPVPPVFHQTVSAPRRPGMPQRHTGIPAQGHRPQHPHSMHRQASYNGHLPAKVNPIAQDVFASGPSSITPARQMSIQSEYYNDGRGGISPARALGPAPISVPQYSAAHLDPMTTPQTKTFQHIPSSATSSSSATDSSHITSSGSSSSGGTIRSRREATESDGGDTESPTRQSKMGIQQMALDDNKASGSSSSSSLPKLPRPVVSCRTSAKFSKVAEDPGVEGVPPGERSKERPSPSFACIIGQSILAAKAGGLSLEHIYRYVETMYPYFKTGDGAWRNSVRHNLSIHKMFETIPRSELYPAGKGGIWIIHEDEKCHWPTRDKFIKNFPASHPHHSVCRQTIHEKQKENEAKAKALAEGREYVPKKGKKGRKLPGEGLEGGSGSEMMRTNSALSDAPSSGGGSSQMIPIQNGQQQQMGIPMNVNMNMSMSMNNGMLSAGYVGNSQFVMPTAMPTSTLMAPPQQYQSMGGGQQHQIITPKMYPRTLHPPPMNETDEELFEPMDPQQHYQEQYQQPIPKGTMVPPRFGNQKRPVADTDAENVFNAPKKVRLSEPSSSSHQSGSSSTLGHSSSQGGDILLDDAYVTPERERQLHAGSSKNPMTASSSMFKTPALINTSSSPGSSPMPPTLPRQNGHLPSGLQQAWTNDELLSNDNSPSTSSNGFSLDAAFDIKPKIQKRFDEDYHPGSSFVDISKTSQNGNGMGPVPPKTPLSRSSAAQESTRTPRPLIGNASFSKLSSMMTPFTMKTPLGFSGSPLIPGSIGNDIMSTPCWDIEQFFERFRGNEIPEGIVENMLSPLRSPSRSSNNASTKVGGSSLALGSVIGGSSMDFSSPRGMSGRDTPSTDPKHYLSSPAQPNRLKVPHSKASSENGSVTSEGSPIKGVSDSPRPRIYSIPSSKVLATLGENLSDKAIEKKRERTVSGGTDTKGNTGKITLGAGLSNSILALKDPSRGERERTRSGEMKAGV